MNMSMECGVSYVVSTDRGGKIKGSLYFYFDKDNIVSKISYADS